MLVMPDALGHLHGNRISGVDVVAIALSGSARCIVADNEVSLPLTSHRLNFHRNNTLPASRPHQDGGGGGGGAPSLANRSITLAAIAPKELAQQKAALLHEEATGKTVSAVAMCWWDANAAIRELLPLDAQRLSFGVAHPTLQVG
jgi:hypothetical protein